MMLHIRSGPLGISTDENGAAQVPIVRNQSVFPLRNAASPR